MHQQSTMHAAPKDNDDEAASVEPWCAATDGLQKLDALIRRSLHGPSLPVLIGGDAASKNTWRAAAEAGSIGELHPDSRAGCRLCFMLMDVTIVDNSPKKQKPSGCTVHMWGVDVDGRSVHALVHNFEPCIFIELPDSVSRLHNESTGSSRAVEDVVRKELVEVGVQASLIGSVHIVSGKRLCGFVANPEWSEIRDADGTGPTSRSMPRRQSCTKSFKYARVSIRSAQGQYTVHRICTAAPRSWLNADVVHETANVPPVQKFLEHMDINGAMHSSGHISPCAWVGLESYEPVPQECQKSLCDIEVQCALRSVHSLPTIKRMAPLLVASTDIECFSDTDAFPRAQNPKDAVICIGTTMARIGRMPSRPGAPCLSGDQHLNVAHVLQECSSCENIQALWFDDEKQMLAAWSHMISNNADVVIGYNLWGFDYAYMCDRSETGDDFFRLGKLKSGMVQPDRFVPGASSGTTMPPCHLPMDGCVTIDMFKWIEGRFPSLTQLKLDHVAKHFLDEGKIEIDYKDINAYYRSGPEQRSLYINYCRRDCELPMRLAKKLKTIQELAEFSQVACTLLQSLVRSGQQVRTMNMLVMASHRQGHVVNTPPALRADEMHGYAGAFVLDPIRGLHPDPVLVLDFASLYPSIIQAKNLCFSTWIDASAQLPPWLSHDERVNTFQIGPGVSTCFVAPTVQKGVLPKLCAQLLASRKATKTKMAAVEKGSDEHTLLDGRQLALKVMCNCVYGFMGAASHGKMAQPAVAATVTSVGREMILRTKALVESPRFGYDVVYGDTDSVFVNPGVSAECSDAVAKAWAIGNTLSKAISEIFEDEVVMEMEAVYFPFLIMQKKRYAFFKYENPRDFTQGCMGVKGIEIVRRDTSTFVRDALTRVVDALMHHRSLPQAYGAVVDAVEALVHDRVPMESLVLTKRLRDGYSSNDIPHLRVAQKIEARVPGSGPQIGDRVPFIILRGASSKVCDRAESPSYVREMQLTIDRTHYLNDLMRPVHNFLGVAGITNIKALQKAAALEIERQHLQQKTLSFSKTESEPWRVPTMLEPGDHALSHRPKYRQLTLTTPPHPKWEGGRPPEQSAKRRLVTDRTSSPSGGRTAPGGCAKKKKRQTLLSSY